MATVLEVPSVVIDVRETGKKIVQARESKGLSRYKLALNAKVDLGRLGELETGTADNVTIEFINKLAIALDIPAIDLISAKPLENKPESDLDRILGLKRSLEKLGTKELEYIGDVLQLPVRGYVRAGVPCVTEQEEDEYMIISRYTVESLTNRPQDVYTLRVEGESISGDGAHTGDHILILPTHTMDINGDLYVIRDPDTGESVVRHLTKTDSQFRIESSNPDYPPLVLDKVEIIGRVLYIQPAGKKPTRK